MHPLEEQVGGIPIRLRQSIEAPAASPGTPKVPRGGRKDPSGAGRRTGWLLGAAKAEIDDNAVLPAVPKGTDLSLGRLVKAHTETPEILH